MPNILRLSKIFGPNGKIPVGHSKAYEDYIARPGRESNIPGTNIPKLRLIPLGPRAVGGREDEVDAIVDALSALRDTTPTA
jgi:hypothetical protein